MIKGHCVTTDNERYSRDIWPTKFVDKPIIGDFIQSESGTILKVISITHYMTRIREAEGVAGGGEVFTSTKSPRIQVELRPS